MLGITNHILVRLAANRCGYSEFSDYLVLGDDIIIFSKEVAQEYQSIITKIGVQISLSKCVVPSEEPQMYGAEFASRLFVDGKEISPLPVGLIIKGLEPQRVIAL